MKKTLDVAERDASMMPSQFLTLVAGGLVMALLRQGIEYEQVWVRMGSAGEGMRNSQEFQVEGSGRQVDVRV